MMRIARFETHWMTSEVCLVRFRDCAALSFTPIDRATQEVTEAAIERNLSHELALQKVYHGAMFSRPLHIIAIVALAVFPNVGVPCPFAPSGSVVNALTSVKLLILPSKNSNCRYDADGAYCGIMWPLKSV